MIQCLIWVFNATVSYNEQIRNLDVKCVSGLEILLQTFMMAILLMLHVWAVFRELGVYETASDGRVMSSISHNSLRVIIDVADFHSEKFDLPEMVIKLANLYYADYSTTPPQQDHNLYQSNIM